MMLLLVTAFVAWRAALRYGISRGLALAGAYTLSAVSLWWVGAKTFFQGADFSVLLGGRLPHFPFASWDRAWIGSAVFLLLWFIVCDIVWSRKNSAPR